MKPDKLPIGIAAFEVMRARRSGPGSGRGYIYVDKTEDIYHMVTEGMYYFMARPRRFGKSLLVSTLKCLFQGQRDLFEGLWIADHGEWEWSPHPVMVIDFNEIAHDTPAMLRQALDHYLTMTAETFQVTLSSTLLVGKFSELIQKLYHATGMPVVVLIDEYDKPIIDHLGKGEAGLEMAKANRDVLRSFFGVLKGATVSPLLRFIFLTGISRFSRVSVFSTLNNLQDISMHRKYATLLGYTQAELERYFKAYVVNFATATSQSPESVYTQLAQYYDGYCFAAREKKVYNPYSVLNALSAQVLQNYWFETGTPTFLVNLLREKQYTLPALEGLQVDHSAFSTFELELLRPEALLFQTGYLTISDIEDEIYILDYPNREVKRSFTKSLLFATGVMANGTSSQVLRLSRYLQDGDLDAFFETVTAIFASIPYDIQTKRDEAYYHTLFYLMLTASGGDAQSSVLTCRGRIDMVVTYPERVYIIEFKCNQNAEVALRQIHERGYATPYLDGEKQVMLIGINFSTEKRNLAAWQTMPLTDSDAVTKN